VSKTWQDPISKNKLTWWWTPAATPEAEAEGLLSRASPGESYTPYLKNKLKTKEPEGSSSGTALA
jgi:hypothetical protein